MVISTLSLLGRPGIAALARRHVTSSLKEKVGTIKRRPKLPTTSPTGEVVEPLGDDVSLVSTDTKIKNAALATCLFSFCFGVALYSMKSVGQAGSDPEDPLATLRLEAAEAQERQDREAKNVDETTAMLQQFQAGEYDPDKYEELEEESKQRKRPWYKFW